MESARQRYTAVYVTLLVLLLGLFAVGRSTTWQTDTELHTISEVVATVLALVIGALSLVRFYNRKANPYLLLARVFSVRHGSMDFTRLSRLIGSPELSTQTWRR